MDIEILGEGEPRYAVLCCVHGDETCGWHAVNRLKEENLEFLKPVKIILANEKAFKLGKRYKDVDLNRVAPGNKESEKLEERLAAEIREELKGLKTIDIHSSESKETPFAITLGQEKNKIELAKSTGLKQLVDMSYVEGGLIKDLEAVAIECGYNDDEEPAEMAYRLLKTFLINEDVIKGKKIKSNPDIFEVYGKEEGENYEFLAKNFEKVREGQVYAKKQDDKKKADRDFYPVLMSTDGYDEMIGFKANKK